jgi:hypothetical protein
MTDMHPADSTRPEVTPPDDTQVPRPEPDSLGKASEQRRPQQSVRPSAESSGPSQNSKPSKKLATRQVSSSVADASSAGLAPVTISTESPSGEEEGRVAEPGGRFLFFAAVPGWVISLVLHLVILLWLAWVTLPLERRNDNNDLLMGNSDDPELTEAPIFEVPSPETSDQMEISDLTTSESIEVAPTEILTDTPMDFTADDLQAAPALSQLDPLGDELGPTSDLLRQIGGISGEGLEGRGQAARARLVREGGGNEGSERAVQMALEWFQRHQNPDGSWSFQMLGGRCPCGNHGSADAAFNGATAMALLPFLGAGNTHKEGQYQREVQAGLYYLLNHQKANGSLVDPGGNLYSHGLCAIALSEAYAMTQDQALMRPAQAALDYIAYAQDPVGGGWRYTARQPGDTSVVGWQLMALKSGKMAYLHVNPGVFVGATRFLDSVQTDSGAAYGYKDPGDRISTTAIGLLCRMYLGWGRDEPALRRGVARMSKSGPSDVDMYYNYYATQVMRHYEGEEWEKWNKQMRDFLIESQATKGHEAGSWHMGDSHSAKVGGRLYNTSMATMVLEVYYRHLPIYRKQATDDDFEL